MMFRPPQCRIMINHVPTADHDKSCPYTSLEKLSSYSLLVLKNNIIFVAKKERKKDE